MADGQKLSRDAKQAMISQCLLYERFPTKTRAASIGFGYSSDALVGAWFSIYVVLWAHKIPFLAAIEKQDLWLSTAVILTIGSIMTFVSLFFSPGTQRLHLGEAGELTRVEEVVA
jgi:hypothetical protein